MKIPLALMDAIRRFTAARGSLRVVEKRTYVFILVPFSFRGNGRPEKRRITRHLIGNGSHVDGTRSDLFLSRVTARDHASSRMTSEPDLSDNRELNCELMWTWFLPNPLGPLKTELVLRKQAAQQSP
jgi:hypothetical protein